MIARSAYAQLEILTVANARRGRCSSMGDRLSGRARVLALTSQRRRAGVLEWTGVGWRWLIAVQPILRFYRLSPLWSFAHAVAIAAALRWLFTIMLRRRGLARASGGQWKGRAQAASSGARRERVSRPARRRRERELPGRLAPGGPAPPRRWSCASTPSRGWPTTSPITPTLTPDRKLASCSNEIEATLDGSRRPCRKPWPCAKTLAARGLTDRHVARPARSPFASDATRKPLRRLGGS